LIPIGLLSASVLLVVYGLTLPPSLTWAHWGADSGDLVTAVARGRLPHPPGFPTYLLLGAAFVRLPWGDPAWRLNLLSALSAAGAAGLSASAAYLLSSSAIVAIVTGLSLGLSPLFWSQALIAEVYAPAALFSAAVLLLALRPAPAWLRSALWGLGVGVHPTLLFLAPLVGESHEGHELKIGFAVIRVYPRPLLFALVTVSLLYGPVLLAWGMAPSPWADLSTPAGWWAYVSGRLYHGYLFGLPLALWPRRLLAWAGLMARQFTPVGALLALWGWTRPGQERRGLALATALAFSAFTLYAVGYNTADSLVYLVPGLPLAALWLGGGLAQAAAWLNRRVRWGAWALLLLPLVQVLLFWKQMDLHRDRSAMEWAERVLEQAPPQAVLLTAQDAHTFTLWYVHDVLDERPDVTIIDRDLWGYEPYRSMVIGDLGLAAASGDLSEAMNRAGRPVVSVSDGQ
jgi:hypothetical protein